ncbi:phage major capsid protein [Microbacterium xylanilyticum]
MNWKALIEQALRRKAALEQQRSGLKAEQRAMVDALADNASFTDEQRTAFSEKTSQVRTLDDQIAEIDKDVTEWRAEQAKDAELDRRSQEQHDLDNAPRGGTFRAQDRDTVYNERNQGEFLRDLFAFSTGQARGETTERLQKHEAEARAAGRISERAAATSTFAGIIPPQYLVDKYALIARAGRPTANVVEHLDLPSDGMSLIIPRGTTGAATAVQTAENTALTTQDEVWSNLTVPVVTVGGYNDISRQAIERAAGVDQIVFADLLGAYAVNVNQQVLSGTGAAGQALGILATAGINQATAFAAAATVQTFYTKLAGAINAVETSRYYGPNVIIMHPRRWNWLLTQLDSSNRPLVVPNTNGPMNGIGVAAPEPGEDVASTAPVGWLFGIPVIVDASIPTSVGSGPEDQVIVARREDLMLWEDPSAPFTLRFEQPLGQQLTYRLVAYGYIAFTAGRYPSAVGVVGGNSAAGFGLVAPTF